MEIAVLVILSLYILLTLALIIFWNKIPAFYPTQSYPGVSITVLIPFRNEEKNIPALIQSLSIQKASVPYEIIFINDHSTDAGILVLKQCLENHNFNYRIIELENGSEGKKQALAEGIRQASYDYILTTDADCQLPSLWIEAYSQFIKKTQAYFVFGPVKYHSHTSLFAKMLQLEFASLVASGASTWAAGYPTMCNGANLCFSKEEFYKSGAYQTHADIPSGDDEFLMHQIYAQHPDRVFFLKSKEAIVTTEPAQNIGQYVQQRIRWSSKWNKYRLPYIKYLAFFIFFSNLNIVISLFSVLYIQNAAYLFLILPTIKIGLDFLYLRKVFSFFNEKMSFRVFCITALIYPFYVIFFGLYPGKNAYEWKNRKHDRH